MPSTIKIRIVGARQLPIMDRSSKLTDAYVEVRFGSRFQHETRVARKSLSPVWQEDVRIEVTDDSTLQDEPVEFRVMDHDVYSANDLIGAVRVVLNPLLQAEDVSGETARRSSNRSIQGWFPIYDTLEGVRGELYVVIRVQCYGDENPFRDSSAGVRFFSASALDPGVFVIECVLGFVEELVVEKDPEYEWSDSFRSARNSNENRQRLLYRLSCTLSRLIGKKVLELGGDAVLGYHQHFDIEGDSGIVARGFGTVCRIAAPSSLPSPVSGPSASPPSGKLLGSGIGSCGGSYFSSEESGAASAIPPTQSAHGRCSPRVAVALAEHAQPPAPPHSGGAEVPPLALSPAAIPPTMKPAGSVSAVDVRGGAPQAKCSTSVGEVGGTATAQLRAVVNEVSWHGRSSAVYGGLYGAGVDTTEKDRVARGGFVRPPVGLENEVSLLTLTIFPANVRVRLGGVVCARSVKFLGRLAAKISDQETRDQWWAELREEVRSHTKALRCKHVVGYREFCVVCDDVCVLSAIGTAAVLKAAPERATALVRTNTLYDAGRIGLPPLSMHLSATPVQMPAETMAATAWQLAVLAPGMRRERKRARRRQRESGKPALRAAMPCSVCHVPYKHDAAPFANMRLVPCGLCRSKWVPEVLLATVEPPPLLPVTGAGVLLSARVCKARIRAKSGKTDAREADASAVSDALVFVEIELHRQLMLKLKVNGMNAAFCLRSDVQVGPQLVMGFATATAVHTPALPPPAPLRIHRNIAVLDAEDANLLRTQQRIERLAAQNRARVLATASKEAEAYQAAVRQAQEALAAAARDERRRRRHRRRQFRQRGRESPSVAERCSPPSAVTRPKVSSRPPSTYSEDKNKSGASESSTAGTFLRAITQFAFGCCFVYLRCRVRWDS